MAPSFAEKSLVGGHHRSRLPELWTLGGIIYRFYYDTMSG